MARYTKNFDPEETYRRIAVDIQEEHCPGLLEFLSTLPFGQEGPGFRAIVYQWFLARAADGTLNDAFDNVISGPGGLSSNRKGKVKAQATRRAPNRPVTPTIKPKRAARSLGEVATLDISSPVQVMAAQEPSHSREAPNVVQTETAVTQPDTLQPSQAIAVTPPLSAHLAAPLAATRLEGVPVDLEKISATQFEALMGLDTMFG